MTGFNPVTYFFGGTARKEVILPPAPSVAPAVQRGYALPVWDRVELIVRGFTSGRNGYHGREALRMISSVVWHDMEGHLAGAISTWNTGRAGATLCLLESGEIVLTVNLDDTAWHAGTDDNPDSGVYGRTPFWRYHNVNPYSIGVELEGFAARPFTPQQAAGVTKITRWARDEFLIRPAHTFDQIAGHHAHGELSTSRGDPGPYFNWQWVEGA